MKYIAVLFIAFILGSCAKKDEVSMISETDFSYSNEGKEINLFTIENKNGVVCQFTNFGARVVSIWTPDKDGKLGDIVVGYGSGDDFLNKKEEFFGAIIGRYGNRIGKGRFVIDSIEYSVPINNGENHLHGGPEGFQRQFWNVDSFAVADQKITFSLFSPDMAMGYPGNVNVQVVYELTDANELKISYSADTDKATVLNLTNHTFFNLANAGRGTINDHQLMMNADYITPVDEGLITTGELTKVEGTPFDFRELTVIGDRVEAEDIQIKYGAGYDHNWVLNDGANDGSVAAAKVVDPVSGRIMEVFTNEPGLQFYGGNFLDGSCTGKYGIVYQHRTAFCLETQHFPDTPNKANFPQVTLRPGETYHSQCIYKFSN